MLYFWCLIWRGLIYFLLYSHINYSVFFQLFLFLLIFFSISIFFKPAYPHFSSLKYFWCGYQFVSECPADAFVPSITCTYCILVFLCKKYEGTLYPGWICTRVIKATSIHLFGYDLLLICLCAVFIQST